LSRPRKCFKWGSRMVKLDANIDAVILQQSVQWQRVVLPRPGPCVGYRLEGSIRTRRWINLEESKSGEWRPWVSLVSQMSRFKCERDLQMLVARRHSSMLLSLHLRWTSHHWRDRPVESKAWICRRRRP
jgi:hypothetical protein